MCRENLKMVRSTTCNACQSGPRPGTAIGRPPRYTDDVILEVIEHGAHTPDAILTVLRLRSKTTLLTRLRRMRDAGLVNIIERPRRDGFSIYSNRSV